MPSPAKRALISRKERIASRLKSARLPDLSLLICVSQSRLPRTAPAHAADAYFAKVTGVCSSCDPGELACTGNGVGLATECGTDTDGKQLYLYNGDCVSSESCPAATYADASKFGKE